jgi:hypothetical protein
MGTAMFPEAGISNGIVRARLALPDAERGYYRATRFDWSGVVTSLECGGHSYFGQWREFHDPSVHDAIAGPVEEFHSDEGGLGYREAPAGGTFVRIGVGALRKPEEREYRRFATYEIENPGRWTVNCGRDRIEFAHELSQASGYAFVYRKRVRLVAGAPEMLLEHSLQNTGSREIETDQYNHNFFVIDGQPAGPDFAIRFPFEARAQNDLKGLAEVRGRQLSYLRVLAKGESILTSLEGFGESSADYDITAGNRRTGAAVRIRGDLPLAKLIFWSIRATVCPEPYVRLRVPPGREVRWTIAYTFCELPPEDSEPV